MKKDLQFFLMLLAATCAGISCREQDNKTARLWLLHTWSDSAKAASAGFTRASFMDLNHDGSFTKDFPSFSYGKWKRAGDSLLLSDTSGNTITYKMATDGDALRIQPQEKSLITFHAFPLDAENIDENPFSITNNKWRVRAMEREKDAEILARLVNHVKYWQVYFKWAHDNEIQSIDVRTIPTPIKIYSNGFKVKPVDSLPESWVRLFYDAQECARANQLLEYSVRKHRINFPKTDNKFEMFISVFEQLQANIQEDHSK